MGLKTFLLLSSPTGVCTVQEDWRRYPQNRGHLDLVIALDPLRWGPGGLYFVDIFSGLLVQCKPPLDLGNK